MTAKLVFKRIFDLLVLFFSHALLAPIWLFLWVVIPLSIITESGFPVFYKQERAGKDGKVFNALKFRTMVKNADDLGPTWSIPNDPRITKIGRILRPTALDELPQIINILKGEMSFVGPRALAQKEIDELSPRFVSFHKRFLVPAGLTGLAQLNAHRDDIDGKIRNDIEYVENLSLWMDVTIILRSIYRTFRAKWDDSIDRRQDSG
ncbi:MAG: sugar transferase [Chloroflexi bacterium]|nr:sugar transferase [Chloroflexota bacterium]|tara:strand:+ start:629 stop:1246 length:618 start_codon:yes stop_codon:yes gene_type:complete